MTTPAVKALKPVSFMASPRASSCISSKNFCCIMARGNALAQRLLLQVTRYCFAVPLTISMLLVSSIILGAATEFVEASNLNCEAIPQRGYHADPWARKLLCLARFLKTIGS